MDYNHLRHVGFSEINIHDPFFLSLKEDYEEFDNWYKRKEDEHEGAYVHYDKNGKLLGFLYIKMENSDKVDDVYPPIEANRIMKIGTFKIEAHGTKMGEHFLKVIFDYAMEQDADVCYMTIFEKHKNLIQLVKKYGFIEWGTKGEGNRQEKVFYKDMHLVMGDCFLDYPIVDYRNHSKYILSIYPKYHSQMFPESILTNESRNIIKDISYTNSIRKNYVCSMNGVENLQRGDVVVLYRTAESGHSAEYSAVATTVCTIVEVKLQNSFTNFNDFFDYTNKYSVFEKEDLIYWYNRGGLKVISMIYNFPLKKRIVRHDLIEKIGLERNQYWGFFEISNEKFLDIVSNGQATNYLR